MSPIFVKCVSFWDILGHDPLRPALGTGSDGGREGERIIFRQIEGLSRASVDGSVMPADNIRHKPNFGKAIGGGGSRGGPNKMKPRWRGLTAGGRRDKTAIRYIRLGAKKDLRLISGPTCGCDVQSVHHRQDARWQ